MPKKPGGTFGGAKGSRKFGKTGSTGERTPRTYAKPAMGTDGDRKPRAYGKPAMGTDGERKPRAFGKPAMGADERKPRAYGKPATEADGERKPRAYGKPATGSDEQKPRTYARPVEGADGGRRPFAPRKADSDLGGERKPRTYARPAESANGERKPRTYARPVEGADGERKPRTYARPVEGADGERKPHTFARPAEGRDGERKPRAFDRPLEGPGGERRPFSGRVRTTARDVALRALKDVAANGAFAAQALDRQLDSAHLLPDDRRLATSIFYAAVENRIRISHILRAFVRNAEPEIFDVLHVACAQLLYLDKVPDHAAVDEAVKQARAVKGQRVGGFVNGVLRNVIRSRDAGDLLAPREAGETVPANVEFSIAPELMDKLTRTFDAEEAEKIAAYRPARRTQTVRPNLMTTTDEEMGAYLTGRGVNWELGLVPHAFLCENAGALANLEDYRTGMFSIQGEGSMLAARAVEVKPGMNVLDACAAPGGKSALLCEIMNGTGRVYAWDVYEHRVELIRAAGRRLKLYNLRPTVRDARTPYEPFDAFLDAVLVDAPCSGLGVMADKPDLRLKFSESDLADLVKLQREILQNCAKLVKVGGLLVYSTCTILPEENEDQVRDFLSHNPQFALEADTSYLPEPLRPRAKDGMIQLIPHIDGVEGFFIARMRRKCL